MKLEFQIDIDAPPEQVFAWLDDPEKAKVWMTSVTSTEILHETPEGVGTTFRERVEEDGEGTDLTGVITGYEENRSIAFHLDGAYNDVDAVYVLEPTPSYTRLRYTATVRFKGITRLVMLVAGRMFKRKIAAQMQSELSSLKKLCEGER